ncbi:hypothetical protein ACIRSS_23520 [Amycolatopsis sp. NPDC101161]|uniref:hypothetical protein n=1 Tax=Amycolatopsis sp. NPDC101161 TaxID=3363940 RepID=UPI0037F29D11
MHNPFLLPFPLTAARPRIRPALRRGRDLTVTSSVCCVVLVERSRDATVTTAGIVGARLLTRTLSAAHGHAAGGRG